MKNSYKQILHSASIIGGASIIGITIGLARTKAVAVLLGPSGIGFIGLLNGIIGTATILTSIGLANSGTRQIAEAAGKNDAYAIAGARSALLWGTLFLAALGTLIFWQLSQPIATYIVGKPEMANDIGILAISVGLNVAAGSQTALLNGLRRIRELALTSILSSLLSTLFGVLILWIWGQKGILIFLILSPLFSFIFGHVYVSKLPKSISEKIKFIEIWQHWKKMLQLGSNFMFASLAVTLGLLTVRLLVQRELGINSLGHFEAAWMISMTYVGFVLQSMGSDYYPRLTATINDEKETITLINQQTEVTLLLSAPIFILMIGFAPWVITLLYSESFSESVTLIHWQILGDILKVASWPMTYCILAKGDGKYFLIIEATSMLIFSIFVWIGLPIYGINSTGIGFLLMYIVNLPLVFVITRKKIKIKWDREIILIFLLLIFISIILITTSTINPIGGAIMSIICSIFFVLMAIDRLKEAIKISGSNGKYFDLLNKIFYRIKKFK